MKLKMYVICVFLLLALAACGIVKNNSSCETLLSESSYLDRNRTLQLDIPSHVNSFKLDDEIYVTADNNSNTAIEVVPDKDLKVYAWERNSWTQVENRLDYLSIIERISPETSDDPGMTVYGILLAFTKQTDPVRACITLEAVADPDGARTKVAAWTEVTLNP